MAAATFKRIRPYGEAELLYLLDKQDFCKRTCGRCAS